MSRRRWQLSVLAGLLAVGVGGAVWWSQRPSDEEIALHFLNRCGEEDYAKARSLLKSNPRIVRHRIGLYDGTLLHAVALFFSSTKPPEMLLAFGADLNARDALGQTPLRCALEAGNEPVARFLLARGAILGPAATRPTTQQVLDQLRRKHPDVKVTTGPAQ